MPALQPLTSDRHRAFVHDLRHRAEQWLTSRGIDQYTTGPRAARAHDDIDAMFTRGEFVGWFTSDATAQNTSAEDPRAVAALTHPDPDFWTADEAAQPQLYLSRFLVSEHGTGAGAQLLQALAEHAVRTERPLIRLDCWKTNHRLHDYYRNQRFQHLRTADVPGRMSGALFERDLTMNHPDR